MNYFNYPCNNYFANQIQYQPLYQPIRPTYYRYQYFQPMQPCHTRRTQLVGATPMQSQTITYCHLPQQDTENQELLKDALIAAMKQSNNKIEKVVADIADLQKAESPVEYILKAVSLLKEVFND